LEKTTEGHNEIWFWAVIGHIPALCGKGDDKSAIAFNIFACVADAVAQEKNLLK